MRGPFPIYDTRQIFTIENDEYIGPAIERGHGWDSWMESYVKKYYRPVTDILDIGGNIGTHALMFSKYISDGGKVHTFEPVYHKIIQKNIDINYLNSTVVLHPYGLSNETTETEFYIPTNKNTTTTNFGATGIWEKTENTVNVSLKKLNDVYKGVPSFIKLDIEGMEPEVIDSMLDLLYEHHPTLIIEMIPCMNKPGYWERYPKMVKKLQCLGYDDPIELPDKNYLFVHGTNLSDSKR